MSTEFHPVSGLLATLNLLQVSQAGAVVHIRLN
ncbi:MAG: enoyl-CoA hydratase, partial [Cytophagales bacterium]|nr:enoyl-CoA hydratase [Rhizobacter sp.]